MIIIYYKISFLLGFIYRTGSDVSMKTNSTDINYGQERVNFNTTKDLIYINR